jgi:hypothetical protein
MASHSPPVLRDLADAFADAWCRIQRDDQNDRTRDYSPNETMGAMSVSVAMQQLTSPWATWWGDCG